MTVARVTAGSVLAARIEQPSTPAAGGRVRFDVQIAPDSISVGDPFRLVIRLRVPAGSRIRWPRLTDSTADVVMQGEPATTDQGTRIGWQEWRTEYALHAWNVGRIPVRLPPITVHLDEAGDSLLVPIDVVVPVRSVLPGDTSLHVPKPARDLFPRVTPWWTQWWLAVLLVAGLGALLLWRSRRARQRQTAPAPSEPHAEARRAFARLEALALAEAGEPGRAAVLALAILRAYLEARIGVERSATSAELLVAVGGDARVPRDRLVSLMAEVDAIKFASRRIDTGRALELMADARALADEIERAEQVRLAAEAAAKEAARQAAAAEFRAHEEAARRASRREGRKSADRSADSSTDRFVWLAPVALPWGAPRMDWLPMVDFAHPWLLLGLVGLPMWWWWQRRSQASGTIRFSRVDLVAAGPQRRSRWVRALPVVRLLTLAALLIAMAGPRGGGRAVRTPGAGIDIVVTLDISSSMLAEDFQPQNRLEVAKDKIKRFVMGRTSDRVGLVAFSGEALTQVPLTADYPVILAAVDNLQVGQLEDGTAIGTAIATAANRLRRAAGRSRVMVLLTDGESNRGTIDPRTAAQAAAAFGVRIYTIGVGSEGLAPVPVGRGLFGLRYENRPVKIDEALLTEIATTSGGRYFRARDAAALQAIYEQIDRLERTVADARGYVRYAEWFRWPAGLAILLLLLELGIRMRREVLP